MEKKRFQWMHPELTDRIFLAEFVEIIVRIWKFLFFVKGQKTAILPVSLGRSRFSQISIAFFNKEFDQLPLLLRYS